MTDARVVGAHTPQALAIVPEPFRSAGAMCVVGQR